MVRMGIKIQNGKKGKDLIIEVPKGTKIKVDNEVYADLHENKSSFIVLEGSKAGRGNYDLISKEFKSSVLRTW